jgi:hypothetical protein
MSNTMNTIARRVLGCILLVGLFFSGCGPGKTITPTFPALPALTDTLAPNPTDTPAPAPTNTATLVPTATLPPPLPSQLEDSLEKAKYIFYDGFDTRSTVDWKFTSCQTIKDGELDYACPGNNSLSRNYVFYAGEGILVDLKKVKSADNFKFGISFFNSDLASPLIWQSFGITDSLNLGAHLVITRMNVAMVDIGIIALEPDVWYRMALAVDLNGRILVMTWDRDNPAREPWKYRNTLGADWSGGVWIFQVSNELPVTLRFDNFYQLEFSKIK